MYRWYKCRVPVLFRGMFQYVKDILKYGTRQSDHLYAPTVKSNLGQCTIHYQGPIIWNDILTAKINPDTSEVVFAKTLKRSIKIGLI